MPDSNHWIISGVSLATLIPIWLCPPEKLNSPFAKSIATIFCLIALVAMLKDYNRQRYNFINYFWYRVGNVLTFGLWYTEAALIQLFHFAFCPLKFILGFIIDILGFMLKRMAIAFQDAYEGLIDGVSGHNFWNPFAWLKTLLFIFAPRAILAFIFMFMSIGILASPLLLL